MESSYGAIAFTAISEKISTAKLQNITVEEVINFLVSNQKISDGDKKIIIDRYTKQPEKMGIRECVRIGDLLCAFVQGSKWQSLLDETMEKSHNPGLIDQSDQPELYAWIKEDNTYKYYVFNVFREKKIFKYSALFGKFKTKKHSSLFVNWIDMIQSNDLEEDEIDSFLDNQFDWAFDLWQG